MLYGKLPADLGLIDLNPVEMMFWMYCPIRVPGMMDVEVPANLEWTMPIVRSALANYNTYAGYSSVYQMEEYVYLTAKTLWVSGDHIGNRPGWHSDGFGSDDVNYIWCDRAPTDFLHIPSGVSLSDDCDISMQQMHAYALRPAMYGGEIVTFPDKHLLRLDPSVIHRSPVTFAAGMRTFAKVSVSKDRYDLVGNSVNHLLNVSWPLVERQDKRNHPSSQTAGA